MVVWSAGGIGKIVATRPFSLSLSFPRELELATPTLFLYVFLSSRVAPSSSPLRLTLPSPATAFLDLLVGDLE
ncbi:unnamed protein product [Citrullus colocynthis]|uniref:Uncharacterized protein n=1 Tax=Citrullus colocynthis TaxID=252529 RepID=A0ABP0Z7F7_9ROSI